ncbi:class I SAM-dependent methyltransferase [Bradyrhizobium sp. CW9]|uniref:class I SAM-dependent methyltransferase n=1 Tax=Bradyrhizobium sp. CW9 TaxID=2782689 RepID=UPI001FF7B52B|nr:class I SAM-dependent methyltransferase [Bradyrhizobium sp. CW9]MCK1328229.1 class I SAM-dependent methyltransferase [Bradyrhizobium sp. CW9]
MKDLDSISGYKYQDGALNDSHLYLVPALVSFLESVDRPANSLRVMDLGCGNGSITELLHQREYSVVGIDPSDDGVRIAKAKYPHLTIDRGSAYDDLSKVYGKFDVVVSLEVVEHIYSPRDYANTIYELLNPGGIAIISTPYHGYLKNIALALTGKLDRHFTALWDHGHIKFWSIRTLTKLLEEKGFKDVRFIRSGRIPVLAKSMVACARR